MTLLSSSFFRFAFCVPLSTDHRSDIFQICMHKFTHKCTARVGGSVLSRSGGAIGNGTGDMVEGQGGGGGGKAWPGLASKTEQKNPIIDSALCRSMCASGLGLERLESRRIGAATATVSHTHTDDQKRAADGWQADGEQDGVDMNRQMSGVETVDE